METKHLIELPIKCPICEDIMVTSFQEGSGTGYPITIKVCEKRVNHRIEYRSTSIDNNHARIIILRYDSNIEFLWAPMVEILTARPRGSIEKTLYATKIGKSIYIPYFTPDFSDYHKLLNKLKTYLVFS